MKLALGTVQFGLPYGIANYRGQVTRGEATAILSLARSAGINVLDTAMAYGESETRLGEVGVSGFRLVTKLPSIPKPCEDLHTWVRERVQRSLARLGCSSVHGLLLHRALDLTGLSGAELMSVLLDLKAEGLFQKIGVSIYEPAELDVVIPHYPLDMIQAPFSLIDRRLLTSGWMDRLHNSGIEIHTRSAFLQGLLLMRRADIPSKFQKWCSLWDRWYSWQEEHSVAAVLACLAYPLSFKQIRHVVVGVDTTAQLEQLINAESKVLSLGNKLPDLACNEEFLINPSNWKYLESIE